MKAFMVPPRNGKGVLDPRTTRQVLFVLVLAFAPGCQAQAEQKCPEWIEVSSEVRSTHSGWQVFGRQERTGERHALQGVAFTDGHPRDRAFLRPASSRTDASKGERTDVYEFSSVSRDGIWLVCQYRETRESLFRPIKAAICEVTTTKRPDSPVAAIACR